MITSVHLLAVGQLYTSGEYNDVWEVESFCAQPTVTLKNLRTGERRGGAVGSPIVRDFTRLVPEPKLENVL